MSRGHPELDALRELSRKINLAGKLIVVVTEFLEQNNRYLYPLCYELDAIWFNSVWEVNSSRTDLYTVSRGQFKRGFQDCLLEYSASDRFLFLKEDIEKSVERNKRSIGHLRYTTHDCEPVIQAIESFNRSRDDLIVFVFGLFDRMSDISKLRFELKGRLQRFRIEQDELNETVNLFIGELGVSSMLNRLLPVLGHKKIQADDWYFLSYQVTRVGFSLLADLILLIDKLEGRLETGQNFSDELLPVEPQGMEYERGRKEDREADFRAFISFWGQDSFGCPRFHEMMEALILYLDESLDLFQAIRTGRIQDEILDEYWYHNLNHTAIALGKYLKDFYVFLTDYFSNQIQAEQQARTSPYVLNRLVFTLLEAMGSEMKGD